MINKFLQDKFIKDNAVFFVGSIIVAILNYLYHPVMSRMMSVEDFGEVQTLISLTYLTGILSVIFGTIATNIVAHIKDLSVKKHTEILSQLATLALYVTGFFALALLVLSPYLRDVLQFRSIASFLPLILIMLVGVPMIFYNAYFRGIKQFDVASITGIIMSSGKIIFAILFVFLGFRVFGAISALALATLCSLLYAMRKARGTFVLNWEGKLTWTPEMKRELSYGMLIFFSLGYITFLYTSDVIMVKYFFSPEIAGVYSGVATIARIIFFATASVAGVLLPTIKMTAKYEENIAVLKKAFMIISLMGVGALGIFFLFPKFIITVLIGEKYLSLTNLLPLAGLYIFLASVTNILYSYSLALRDKRLITTSLIGFLVIIGLIWWHHDSPRAIVIDYIIGAAMTIIVTFVVLLFSKRKEVRL
ncbi:MAG: hypothetical protein CR972_02310 [Candidatus Moraniibacteriota bacterium]|nr:MAG: hypothetical protein CR972_02310 [Candidatus Moranbacteria bacterium]